MAEDKTIAIEVEVKGVDQSIESMKDLKGAIKAAKDEQLKAASAYGEGSKEFQKATKRVSDLKDKVEDLADSTKSLKGSGIERASEGFSQLGEGLRNLDFDKVKVGLTAMKSALAAVGIGLIVQAVVYLVENFESLSKGSGVLAKSLRFVGDIITSITDAAYALTDALGLTNHALDVQGETIVKNAEKTKEALGEQTSEYDRLIAVAKANGESTVELEIAKQKAIQATNAEILKQMLAYVKAGGVLDEEQQKLLKATLANVKDTHTAIQVIESTDRKDKTEKENKANEERKTAFLKAKDEERAAQLLRYNESIKQQQDELAALKLNQSETQRLKEEARLAEMSVMDAELAASDAKVAERNKTIEADKAKELADHEAFEKDKVNITSDATLKGLQAVQSLTDLYFQFKRNSLQKGSAEELAAAKKQFKINKALAITTATIQGVQGVLAAFSSGAAVPVVGAVLGPAYAILAGVVAAANIAKIASAKFDEGGGGGGGGAVTSGGANPSVPIPSPPSINTPSANTNQSTTFDASGKNLNAQQPTIKIEASIGVDEINSKQNRVNVLEKQATF